MSEKNYQVVNKIRAELLKNRQRQNNAKLAIIGGLAAEGVGSLIFLANNASLMPISLDLPHSILIAASLPIAYGIGQLARLFPVVNRQQNFVYKATEWK